MSRHITRHRLVFIAALLLAGLTGTLVAAGEVLRMTRNIPGDSKPIVLNADAAATWSEGGERVILLSGKVLVEHGLFSTRCTEAVLWIDENNQKKTRILRVQLYAEGEAVLENGTESKRAEQALVDLYTRGEVKLRIQAKVVQEPKTKDPLYLRALAARSPTVAAPAATPKPPPASVNVPAGSATPQAAPGPPVAGPVQPTSFQDYSPTTPAPAPPQPTPTPPAPTRPVVVPAAKPPAPGPSNPPTTSAVPPAPTGGLMPRAAPSNVPRIVTVSPRTMKPFEWQSFTLSTGEKAIVVTGGVTLLVRNLQNAEIVDIEADKLVFWSQNDTENMFSNMRSNHGQATRELEFYLAGNVEIRQQSRLTDDRTLRAEQVYYDVGRNVAVAIAADLEMHRPPLPDPIHMKAEELLQLSPTLYEASGAEIFASRLPSDPGLKVFLRQATLEQQPSRPSRNPRLGPDGKVIGPEMEPEFYFRGTSVFFEVENPVVDAQYIPFFYLPWMQGDVRRPLGPLIDASLGGNRIFGFRSSLTFDAYDLFGITPILGTRWRLDVDYLSSRGPAMGTSFDYSGKDLCDIPGIYSGYVHSWGLRDWGQDILGGNRNDQDHPPYRGWMDFHHDWKALPYGFSIQTQVVGLSDKNFYEQYFKNDFDTTPNLETYLYVKQQNGIWAWTALAEPRLRTWVTETEWLPRWDGYVLGASPFDLFTYSTHASAGYAQLKPTNESPPANQFPVTGQPTQVRTDTTRLDLWQELALPFYIGPVKAVPYGIVDLTYYSQDLTGNEQGRFYGAGGLRASMPLSHLYGEVHSELWNLNGIYHKIAFNANYYIAHSDVPFNTLPQLDLLQDDATDQSLREMTPYQTLFNPQHGLFLMTSQIFDPQLYAIRRLVDDRIDTLDTVEVLQADIRQRLQTKRGYPGMQHEVDWMVLDVSASYFPHPSRDNFGESWAFFEYNYLWNIGDRTAVTSTAWVDPFSDGPRVFTIGASYNRPDRTTFSLGYRHISPLNSDAVSAAVTYIFSPKYAMTASTVYDFGTSQALANSLIFTRMGSDLQVSVGITYNVLQNNFGATFTIIPNLLPNSRNLGGGGGGMTLTK